MEDGTVDGAKMYGDERFRSRSGGNLKVCIVCGFVPEQFMHELGAALDRANVGKLVVYDAKVKYQEEVRAKGLRGRQTRRERLSAVEEELHKFLSTALNGDNDILINFCWVPDARQIFQQLECDLRDENVGVFWLQGIFCDNEGYRQEMRRANMGMDYRLCFATHVHDGSIWAFHQEQSRSCLFYKRESEGWEDEFYTLAGKSNGVRECIAFYRE